MTTVLCVPQWQGSGARGAARLVEGARRTTELVPADARVTVPVIDAAGEWGEGVRALDVLRENLRLIQEALAGIDDVVLTAGGTAASSSARSLPLVPGTANGWPSCGSTRTPT